MLAPLLETQRQRGVGLRWRPQSVKRFEALTEPTGETSLCNPSFSSQVHIQTAKCSLQCLLRKYKRKSVPRRNGLPFFTVNFNFVITAKMRKLQLTVMQFMGIL
jgi:hypothetical protein